MSGTGAHRLPVALLTALVLAALQVLSPSGDAGAASVPGAAPAGGDTSSGTAEREPLPLPPGESLEQAVTELSAVLDMDDLSRTVWPDWEISETAFALHGGAGGFCVLVNHPGPPDEFEGRRTSGRSRKRFHVSDHASIDPSAARLNGESTAFIDWRDFEKRPLPTAFERAFQAHLLEVCEDLAEIEPPIDGYPLTPENLALADIECELLARASAAPEDSLEQWTLDFVAVRNYRRLRMESPAAEGYESRLERLGGLSVYVGERARTEARDALAGDEVELLEAGLDAPLDAVSCLVEPGGLDWYRRDRFCATGAVLCGLLDRFHPGWRRETGECGGPYEMLYELTMTRLPRAFEVFMRYDLQARIEERDSFIQSLKSDAERLFDGIVAEGYPRFVVNTGLLQSNSVSYDPENLERVDDSRMVHKRVLKIEYSGGTRVHVMGTPSAVNVGVDEFDIQQLTIRAPEDFAVRVAGEPVALTPGVHEFDQPLSVSAEGLLIEARTGVIMVGEEKVTFMLHR